MQLSSDHTRYVIHQPKIFDWVAFVGGMAVVVYIAGKLFNRMFCRKKFISHMMNILFEVQDVSKLSNIKKVNYTDKKINEVTSQYKNNHLGTPLTPRRVVNVFG